jgi:hypothetical protein
MVIVANDVDRLLDAQYTVESCERLCNILCQTLYKIKK